ncbi:hypothetical protein DTO164E3_1341 [Paecilomyces variotii]|nr:hypothetical protein DTO032I3_9061 [Paecilomyces variotii]KAJ9205363.1 hypothetical protein DTO164E3_1341 [Paecilomyces variotii]KAJ9280505.1 hypothetical protein DTO021D3_2725 [Paecilomyces variotii]KAJ9346858.1 hypothetical protein DTO027B6_425 [Paecilomyces variotii]KAJ9354542.1 hypothetical protein DTO027B9_4578 [Paecilomyces variotii]
MSSMKVPIDGLPSDLRWGDALRLIVVTFLAISWYNVIELVALALSTFRQWRGLYFWSLLISSFLGVMPYSLGFMLKYFSNTNSFISVTILTAGWWAMVTGQALVLYSRLHLVLQDDWILRRVLYMICANVVFLHIPTTVLTYGSNIPHGPQLFREAYGVMEKIQITGFTVQEAIISGLYVIESVRLLRIGSEKEDRKTIYQLVGINIFIVLMDILLLSLEYADYYALQVTLKGTIYSLKLKLEFAILGRLLEAIRRGSGSNVRLQSFHSLGNAPIVPHGHPYSDGESATDIMTTQRTNSTTERNHISQGKLLGTKHFTTWIEKRQPTRKPSYLSCIY